MALGLSAGIIISSAPQQALAQTNWLFSTTTSATIDYNDNIRQSPSNEEAAQGLFVTPSASLVGTTERSSLRYGVSVDIRRYWSVDNRDTDNPSFNFSAIEEFEKSTLTVPFSVRETSTNQTELEDSGLVNFNVTQRSLSLSPSWSVRLSERDSMSFSGGFSDISYDGARNFIGRRTYNLGVGWAHKFRDEVQDFNFNLGASFNRPDGANPSNTDTFTFRAGRQWDITERLAFSTLSGLRLEMRENAASSSPNAKRNTLGTDLQASLTYAGELYNLSSEFRQTSRPSSVGTTVEENSLTIAGSRQITENLSLNVNTSARFSETSGDSSAPGNEFYTVSPSLSWRLTEDLNLSTQYTFRRQSLGNAEPATSNSARVTLQYNLR